MLSMNILPKTSSNKFSQTDYPVQRLPVKQCIHTSRHLIKTARQVKYDCAFRNVKMRVQGKFFTDRDRKKCQWTTERKSELRKRTWRHFWARMASSDCILKLSPGGFCRKWHDLWQTSKSRWGQKLRLCAKRTWPDMHHSQPVITRCYMH